MVAPRLPARFNRPVIITRTGSACVLRARDADRGVEVAIKAVRGGQGGPVPPAAAMIHPNVVQVFEWIELPPSRCCVMEYVDGPSLAVVIERLNAADAVRDMDGERLLAVVGLNRAALAPGVRDAAAAPRPYFRLVCEWMIGLCGGVAHAHGHGLVHTDIKPANVLIGSDGTPKLGDFGASPGPGAAGAGGAATPAYIAPERLAELLAPRRSSADPATDIWGLGLVLYELLTLRPAYEGATVHEALRAVATLDPVFSAGEMGTLPPTLVAACGRAVRRNPTERFPSADAFGGALRDALSEQSGTTRRPSRSRSGSTA